MMPRMPMGMPRGPPGPRPPPPGMHGHRPPGPPVPRPPMVPPAAMLTAGNVTNDPSTAHCRVFVGNLNTIAMTKEDVEAIFCKYGRVTGISIHKGYAFVQYARPVDARRARGIEDGKTYAGQTLDCNIASEPKKGATGKAPPTVKKTPSTPPVSQPQPVPPPSQSQINQNQQGGPPAKKMKVEQHQPTVMKRTLVSLTSGNSSNDVRNAPGITRLAQAGKDVLICGVCKTTFNSLHSLAQHKKIPCRLKISCQCQSTPPPGDAAEPNQLTCASCDAQFSSAWALCQHCQGEHNINIFKSDTEEVIEEVVVLENDGGGDSEVNGE